MRRIPPATKVRHARAQHAAQSAKQPPDLCFLLQASINKLRIPARSLVCRLRLGRDQLQPSARGRGDRHGERSEGAAAASSARSQHATSSRTTAGMAANIIRVPHNPRPAACHLRGRAPTPPAPRPARSLRAQSFLALPAGASGAQVATQHAATACFKQSHSRSASSDAAQDFTAASSIQHPARSVQALAPTPGELLRNHLIATDSHAARRPLTIKIKGNLAAASAISGSGAPSGDFTSSSAASNIRALCTGTNPGRLQDGAADGTSAGAVALNCAR